MPVVHDLFNFDVMVSRLLIIAIFLFLPIAIALLSQMMANTVAAPQLPSTVIEVKLLPTRTSSQGAGDSLDGQVQSYIARPVEQVGASNDVAVPAQPDSLADPANLANLAGSAGNGTSSSAALPLVAPPAQASATAKPVPQKARSSRPRNSTPPARSQFPSAGEFHGGAR